MDLVGRLQTLKSARGILSVGSVLFPGAAYWLDIKSIKSSALSDYYLMTATPLGALALLLALMLSGDRRSTVARNIAVLLALVVAPATVVGFVTASVSRADAPSPEKGPERCFVTALGNTIREGYETFTYRTAGRITTVKRPCECYSSGPGIYEDCRQTGPVETIEDVINPAEYKSLVWFNLSIIALTLAFTLIAGQLGRQSQVPQPTGEVHPQLVAVPGEPRFGS